MKKFLLFLLPSTRAASQMPYYIKFDIFNTFSPYYYTFLITTAQGFCVDDKDPLPFFYDDNDNPFTLGDYSQYIIYHGSDYVYFDDMGLRSSVPYDYDFENGVGFFRNAKLGDKIAIWASEKNYTYQDFHNHDGDSIYFAMVSETFKCCYIATLKKYMTIVYAMYDSEWHVYGNDK